MPLNNKITHYIDKTLLNFVEFYSPHIITLYLFFHYIFVIIPNSFFVKIYCFRDYFMLIIVQLTWQWPITASMLYINLDSLPLFQCFDKISLYIFSQSM